MDRFIVGLKMTGTSSVIEVPGIHFDSLLAHQLILETGDFEKAHSEIPLKQTDGVWWGSLSMIEEPFMLNAHTVSRKLNAIHEITSENTAGSGRRNTIRANDLRGIGNILNQYITVTTANIYFAATGDADKVTKLLFHPDGSNKLRTIGKLGNRGFGQIETITIESVDNPMSGIASNSGAVVRPVPTRLSGSFEKPLTGVQGYSRITPPYWKGASERCLLPPDGRISGKPDELLQLVA